MPDTFAPPQGPSFQLPETRERRSKSTVTDAGYRHSMPFGLRAPRVWRLQWAEVGRATYDYLQGFLHRNDALSFYWVPPVYESPPDAAPTGVQVTSGALGSRNYFAAFAWYDNTGALVTTLSPDLQISMLANRVLKLTVPIFPSMADRARIYVGTTSGGKTLQATVSTRTWQEPDTGLVAGAAVPSANTLKKALLFVAAEGQEFVLLRPDRWRIELTLHEVAI